MPEGFDNDMTARKLALQTIFSMNYIQYGYLHVYACDVCVVCYW